MFAILLAAAVIPGFVLHTSSPRADYYVRADTKLQVSPEVCDRELAKIEQELGVHVPRFEYLRVADEGGVFVFSRQHHYAGGVAEIEQLRIIAVQPCSRHELVHLATGQLGRADLVFEEGVAGMLAGDNGWLSRHNTKNDARYVYRKIVTYASINATFRSEDLSAGDRRAEYILADGWVRHLRKDHGMAQLAKFFRAQCAGKDAHAAFHEVYDGDLDKAFEFWLYGKKGPPKR